MRIGVGFIGVPMVGGSPAWFPTNISGLNLWVRSDMGTTVHEPAFPVPTDFTNAAWTKIHLTPTLVSGTVYELDEGLPKQWMRLGVHVTEIVGRTDIN